MKPKYLVRYELNGRKMQTKVEANTDIEAINIIKNRLIIHSAERNSDDEVDFLTNMFNMKR